MKKKIIAILVCGVFAVGMIGCNSSSDTEEETEQTEETEETEETGEETEQTEDQSDEAEEETVSDAEPDESATELIDQFISDGNEFSSPRELIDMLVGEGYSEEVAKATVDAYDYDWDNLALEDLGSLHAMHAEDGKGCSPSECSDWLEEDGFTSDAIDYALANSDIDWNEEAVAKVNAYLEVDSERDREDILKNLEMNGFTTEQAEHGADNSNLTSEE